MVANELCATRMEELECWCKEYNLSQREALMDILMEFYEAAGFYREALEAEFTPMSDDELMKAYLIM